MTRSRWTTALCALVFATAACGGGLSSVRGFERDRNVAELVRAATDESSAADVRAAAGHALRRIGAPAVMPLIEKLKDPSWAVRGHAADVLGSIGDRRASRPLVATLEVRGVPTGYVRAAGRALMDLADPATIATLRRMPTLPGIVQAADSIEQSQRCRAEPACTAGGRCGADATLPAGQCFPRSDADCRASDACGREQRCFRSAGGSRCVADICAERKSAGCE
jgi:hypothetical protein